MAVSEEKAVFDVIRSFISIEEHLSDIISYFFSESSKRNLFKKEMKPVLR